MLPRRGGGDHPRTGGRSRVASLQSSLPPNAVGTLYREDWRLSNSATVPGA